MLNGIRLRNFRSLADSGMVELRPITLLLGQNSSGKSTFLRALPLIRQSLRIRSNAPLLWYGDLVDFGSIREVKSSFAGEGDHVGISFHFDTLTLANQYGYSPPTGRLDDIEMGIFVAEVEGSTYLRGMTVRVGPDQMEISLGEDRRVTAISVNGADHSKSVPRERMYFTYTDLVPLLYLFSEPKSDAAPTIEPFLRPSALVEQELFSFFSYRFDKRVSAGTIRNLARRLYYGSEQQFVHRLRTTRVNLKSWPSIRDGLLSGYGHRDFSRLRSLYFLGILPDLLFSVSNALNRAVSDLAYVGPSRATGERYYRHQELAIDQIDPQGQNMAMFLYSLSMMQREEFSKWLEQQIGYSLKVDREGGHVQISLREVGSPNFHNLADMGYGFSQILPVMAQIWGRNRLQSPSRRSSPFLVVEQPELHLHPAYQARIADVMTAAVNQQGASASNGVSFLVETHSESLINRLGELIYKKALSPDMVAIYLFHRLAKTDATEITKSTFDENGTLKDWPLGFFSSKAAI